MPALSTAFARRDFQGGRPGGRSSGRRGSPRAESGRTPRRPRARQTGPETPHAVVGREATTSTTPAAAGAASSGLGPGWFGGIDRPPRLLRLQIPAIALTQRRTVPVLWGTRTRIRTSVSARLAAHHAVNCHNHVLGQFTLEWYTERRPAARFVVVRRPVLSDERVSQVAVRSGEPGIGWPRLQHAAAKLMPRVLQRMATTTLATAHGAPRGSRSSPWEPWSTSPTGKSTRHPPGGSRQA